MAKNESIITPWEVSGEIDYNYLIESFGTKHITPDLLDRMRDASGSLHFMLRRGVFYSHRDLDVILDHYESSGRFCLYTGRGPSGPVHLGHLIPWVFTKYLQDKYDCKLLFQFTDDEKMLIRDNYDAESTGHWVYENALDLMALGFDPDNTEFLVDMRHVSKLFPIALKIAKRITSSTMRAVFGFNNESNLGIMFFPSMQAAPCFMESERARETVPCLIPAGIDQDPYWRLTRDVAQKIGYPKPAQVHGRILPGLTGDAKMSSSKPETAIYVTDVPELVEEKILNAVVPENRRSCPLYLYHYFLFTESDEDINELYNDCTSGNRSCVDCRHKLVYTVNRYLKAHQMRRRRIGKSVMKMLE